MGRVQHLWLVILFPLLAFCAATDGMKFQVFEEQDPGTFVGDMSANHLVRTLSDNENLKGALRFQFQGSLQTSFKINETTGIIRTAAKLDRENLSLENNDDTFQIQVKVSKGVVTVPLPIEIKVLDINDHSPIFADKIENFSVSESAPLDAEFPVTVAEDTDIGNYSVQSYEIVERNDSGTFDLILSRPTSEITKLKLVLSKRLDREINESFFLEIEARDGGSPRKVGRKGLRITVLDSNDHIPKFSKDLYVGEVRENSPAGTFVLNVTASDKDIGTNGEISYSLNSRPQYKDLFSLDARTGELRTKAILDYERFKDYQLEVTARDRGPDSIPTTSYVNVKVLDENDNAPEISVTLFPDEFDEQEKIPEDIALKTSIAQVTVRDKDSGRNGRVTVTLQHHKDDLGLREMFAGLYILEIRHPLSLDRHDQYKIKIVAEDQGSPISQKSSYVLVVKVADSNRNAPRFDKNVYNVGVNDDVKPGTFITTLTATDEDDGNNSELTYSLEDVYIGEHNSSVEEVTKWFAIDSKNGQVQVLRKLWCAFTPIFQLNIDVRDNGRVPFHDKTALKISVQCSKNMYNFSVTENEPEGVEVGRVALEPIESNRPLGITLLSHTTEFAIDENKGILTTKTTLDRERKSFYSLIAVITDGRVAMNVTLFVEVEDVKDNAPIFVGLENTHNLTLSGALFIGATVQRLRATDKDSGTNGLVKYLIVSGNNDLVFLLNMRTGRITLNREPSRKLYILTIRAADSGDVENEAYLRLIISVRYITPAPPPSGDGSTDGNGEVELRTERGGFFSDTKMIIIVGACAGFLILSILLVAVFIMKFRRKDKKEDDKRGSYHEPDISREDALKASKKMFQQATTNPRQAAEAYMLASRKQPINVSPIPIKKMHSTMTYQAPPGTGSPTRSSRQDMYYPFVQGVVECHSSEDEIDSGRGGSSHESTPYYPHSPPSKKREDDFRPPHRHYYHNPHRARSPNMPPPPPPYEEVQTKRAYVSVSGVTHSTTEL
ncbi:protocadherin alpha-13-like [Stylophora pistillata]|uniref:Protocadherin-16 n=1 Tax=Stylophora pistillata TaxID=50429 RepID=A0A2B4RW67_STYPI|nr:protocadherin alpha-13-like [Stylophora pistillata]XP_022798263.1 protocadherin alpha-13-like [Stylophora pistillata]XP_022798264.1 protocadherin alpha-13-like [Stylophora pistillata]PFX20810.1 Protocadherin-16 [Stylophora pistillata]